MLRIPKNDLDRAHRQAAGRGLGCQTDLKMLLREDSDRQEKWRRTARKALLMDAVRGKTSTLSTSPYIGGHRTGWRNAR